MIVKRMQNATTIEALFFFGLYWLLINYFGDSYILGAHKFEFVLST